MTSYNQSPKVKVSVKLKNRKSRSVLTGELDDLDPVDDINDNTVDKLARLAYLAVLFCFLFLLTQNVRTTTSSRNV